MLNQFDPWPELPYETWASTKKTLQMCAQMLGKTRLALAPPQPEWLHTCLYLDGRGFTTGVIPWKNRLVWLGIDVFDLVLRIEVSDGRATTLALGSDRCVADIWNEFQRALMGFGIGLDIWEKPQEVRDTTWFSENMHDCHIEPSHAQRFYALLATLNGVFERFRSNFFGRSGVQFWWGSFDFTVLLFNGNHAEAPDDRGYILRYDLDAEHFNAGFFPGDDDAPAPVFYGYITPRPDGAETARMNPEHVAWTEALGEWVIPYDAIRTSDKPDRLLLDFLESIYRVAVTNGGWDAEHHRYTQPPPSRRGQKAA